MPRRIGQPPEANRETRCLQGARPAGSHRHQQHQVNTLGLSFSHLLLHPLGAGPQVKARGGIGPGEVWSGAGGPHFSGLRLEGPSFPMAGHLASDFSFSPPPGGGGDVPGGPEPSWVDPRTWLSFQGPPGGPGVGLGAALGSEAWGVLPCPQPYEFCGGVPYCGPQAGVGLAPQGGLEGSPPDGEVGAPVESGSEGASPEPCASHPGVVKVEKEKPEQNPEEVREAPGWVRGGGRLAGSGHLRLLSRPAT